MASHAAFASQYVDLAGDDALTRVARILARDGLVTFDRVYQRQSVVRLALRLLAPWRHRDADADGVTVISDRGSIATRPGYAGFGARGLEPHTDSSALDLPPRLVMLVCARSADCGGESYVVDGAAVYHELASRSPELLKALQQPRTVRFASHWGSVFETVEDGWMRIRLRLDGVEHFTPPVTEAVPVLRAAIERHTREIVLLPGQGYLLDNWRMLHGRRNFRGPRLMYRVLGDPVAGCVLPPGFAPSPGRALLPQQRIPECPAALLSGEIS
ncbi:TauD/TfdA family dioxygenase [Nonomuraea angiospora]|uniref:TauD/TfdA family dioxygenase n=1 Tax=Nonomuraea angiospora TaxID=46172 RepID=UPI00344F0AF5